MSVKKATTHTLIANALTIALRERSSIWQCRICVDGVWQRITTGERELKAAKEAAHELYIEAQVRKKNNIVPITRYFKDVARVVVKKLKEDQASGHGKVSYRDYITVIEKILIPLLGKYKIDSINYQVLEQFNEARKTKLGKEPAKSTLLTHNAALNRVFDEAIFRGYMIAGNKPVLAAKGKKSVRRVEFSVEEVRALRGNFEAWIENGRADAKAIRALLRDYVEILLDTGARPGKELLDLRWANIQIKRSPRVVGTGKDLEPDEYDQEGSEEFFIDPNHTVYITILTGKTSKVKGGRIAIGYLNTFNALERIAQRNYQMSVKELIKKKPNDSIFRFIEYQSEKNGKLGNAQKFLAPTSFTKLFQTYLEEHGLLIDPVTNQKRQAYSLRHTYATIRLLHDKVTPQVLVKQMGTSIAMLEKHYDHIETIKSSHQLRDNESRSLIAADVEIDDRYKFREVKKKKS